MTRDSVSRAWLAVRRQSLILLDRISAAPPATSETGQSVHSGLDVLRSRNLRISSLVFCFNVKYFAVNYIVHAGSAMPQQITARLPDPVVAALDAAARQLQRSRAAVIRQAIDQYLEDFDDLSVALDRLRDPSDPVLDWDQVRGELLDTD